MMISRKLQKDVELIKNFDWLKVISIAELVPGFTRLEIEVTLNVSSFLIEFQKYETTKWVVIIQNPYPFGSIEVYPGLKDSIIETFPHQLDNSSEIEKYASKSGKLCLEDYFKKAKNRNAALSSENTDSLLKIIVCRLQFFLTCAFELKLQKADDHFEFPSYPNRISEAQHVIFQESVDSYANWEGNNKSGYFEYVKRQYYSDSRKFVFPISYKNNVGEEIACYHWHPSIDEDCASEKKIGLWAVFETYPFRNYWAFPNTYSDLLNSYPSILAILKDSLNVISSDSRLMPNDKIILINIGFPVFKLYGDAKPAEISWIAFTIDFNQIRPASGENKKKFFDRYLSIIFQSKPSQKIVWEISQNWSKENILQRGKSTEIGGSSFVVVGGGALGSFIIENLVRLGVNNILIHDDDEIEIGNLSRYSASLKEVGVPKAVYLKSKLELVRPGIRIEACRSLNHNSDLNKLWDSYEIIIDVTADDKALSAIEHYQTSREKVWISTFLGFNAKRLYIFASKSSKFLNTKFEEEYSKWKPIELEEQKINRSKFVPEGIGCWHPLFPARIDDIYSYSSAIVKNIEKATKLDSGESFFYVYEQVFNKEEYIGIRKAS